MMVAGRYVYMNSYCSGFIIGFQGSLSFFSNLIDFLKYESEGRRVMGEVQKYFFIFIVRFRYQMFFEREQFFSNYMCVNFCRLCNLEMIRLKIKVWYLYFVFQDFLCVDLKMFVQDKGCY